MIPTSGGHPHIMFKLRRSLLPLLLVSVALSTTGQADFCSRFAPHDAGPWINLLESANPRTPPQWSPDGAYLVFTKAFDVFEGDTYVVSADGSSLMMISARQGGGMEVDFSPSFSPDGTRIVYSTSRHPVEGTGRRYFNIETSPLDGSQRQQLTASRGHDSVPAWSPDGERIAFLKGGYPRNEDNGIYTMARDGTDQRLVMPFSLETPGRSRGPTWSPDGKKLAYVLLTRPQRPNQNDRPVYDRGEALYTVDVDGSNPTLIFTVEDRLQESITTEPAWSPDSQRIAFVHQTQPTEGNQGMVKLYTVRPDGSDLTLILGPDQGFLGLGHSGVLSWSPDGTRILLCRTRYTVLGPLSIVNVDGTDWQVIGGTGAHAAWSPDGTKIATLNDLEYTESDPSIFLSTINRDGTDLQVLVRIDEEGNLTAGNPQK